MLEGRKVWWLRSSMQWIVEALQSNLSSPLNYTIPYLLESTSADASDPEKQLCTSWGLKLLGEPHTPSWFYYQAYAKNTQPQNPYLMLDPYIPCLPNIMPGCLANSCSKTWENTELFSSSPPVCFSPVVLSPGNDTTIHTVSRNVDIAIPSSLSPIAFNCPLDPTTSPSYLFSPLPLLLQATRMLDLDYYTRFLPGLLASVLPNSNPTSAHRTQWPFPSDRWISLWHSMIFSTKTNLLNHGIWPLWFVYPHL